jgi:DNA modification methylase
LSIVFIASIIDGKVNAIAPCKLPGRVYTMAYGKEIYMTRHKIIIGDSRRMTEIDDKSIQLIITSPPYWQLKDYGNGSQIGFDDTYENYINNLRGRNKDADESSRSE